MSTMVSARIPAEMYDQGMYALNKIGASTTDLIVSVFKYVIEEGKLPGTPHKTRHATKEQALDLQNKLAASCLHLDIPADWDYKQELAEGKWADYEALA